MPKFLVVFVSEWCLVTPTTRNTTVTQNSSKPHRGRYRSDAAFAAHAGGSPVPASSGLTTRHRLNRGGDRQMNAVLHQIVMTRMRLDPVTITYVQRRTAEGKTVKEIRRCLKRGLLNHLRRMRLVQRLADTPEGRDWALSLKLPLSPQQKR